MNIQGEKIDTWRVQGTHPIEDGVNKGGFDQFEADAFAGSLLLLGYKDVTVYNGASACIETEDS